jgi:hypothetical protein
MKYDNKMKTIIDSYIEKGIKKLSIDTSWGQRVYNLTDVAIDDKVLTDDLLKKIKSKTITSVSELDQYINECYFLGS